MEKKPTCRRCSVNRVNMLCGLYDRAYREDMPESRKAFQALVELAGKRGYPKGMDILQPGLSEKAVRKLCWNISSLLTDDDLKHLRDECS